MCDTAQAQDPLEAKDLTSSNQQSNLVRFGQISGPEQERHSIISRGI